MTAPPRPRKIIAGGGLTGRQLESEVSREVARIQEEHQPVMPTGRCRVCQHPESRSKVNTLLAYGMGSTEILEFVDDINSKRSKNNKITLDSIRNHRQRHFNVQAPTQAGFRRILERRKAQLSDEFADAAGGLLTGMAYLDVVASKGWQHLIDDDTKVPYQDGLQAMLKLEEMQRDGQVEEQVAQMRRDVALLRQAVQDVASSLPEGAGERLLQEIGERIDELSGVGIRRSDEEDIVDAEVVDYYDQDDEGDKGYDPIITSDDGDSIED